MADKPVLYVYGRLHINASYDDKRAYILQGLGTDAILRARGHVWQFIEIEELESDSEAFIHGYLVKYKPEFEQEVVVRETGKLSDTEIKNFVVAKSRFFLHIETGLIAYHREGNLITAEQFRHHFAELFMENHQRFFMHVEIETVDEQYHIRDELRRMTAVSRVKIALHPSNPHSTDAFKRIDDRLKRLGVDKYNETYDTKPEQVDGVDIISDEELLAKLLMAEDGLGTVRVSGRIDGKTKTISTRDRPVTQIAPGEDAPAKSVLENLMTTTRVLFKRFGK